MSILFVGANNFSVGVHSTHNHGEGDFINPVFKVAQSQEMSTVISFGNGINQDTSMLLAISIFPIHHCIQFHFLFVHFVFLCLVGLFCCYVIGLKVKKLFGFVIITITIIIIFIFFIVIINIVHKSAKKMVIITLHTFISDNLDFIISPALLTSFTTECSHKGESITIHTNQSHLYFISHFAFLCLVSFSVIL